MLHMPPLCAPNSAACHRCLDASSSSRELLLIVLRGEALRNNLQRINGQYFGKHGDTSTNLDAGYQALHSIARNVAAADALGWRTCTLARVDVQQSHTQAFSTFAREHIDCAEQSLDLLPRN